MDRDTKIRFQAAYNILSAEYEKLLEYTTLVAELKSREPDLAAIKAEIAEAKDQLEEILQVDLPDDGGLGNGEY